MSVKKERTGLRRGGCFFIYLFIYKVAWWVRSRPDSEWSTVSVSEKIEGERERIWQIKRDSCAGFMRKQLDRVAKQRRRRVNRKRKERWMGDDRDERLMSGRGEVRPAVKQSDVARSGCLHQHKVCHRRADVALVSPCCIQASRLALTVTVCEKSCPEKP